MSKFVTVVPISEFGDKEKQLVQPTEKEMVLANESIK